MRRVLAPFKYVFRKSWVGLEVFIIRATFTNRMKGLLQYRAYKVPMHPIFGVARMVFAYCGIWTLLVLNGVC